MACEHHRYLGVYYHRPEGWFTGEVQQTDITTTGTMDMSGIKSLWASVQGDPVFMRRVNGWFTIFWIVMIPISILLGLLSSVVYVSALSLWALVSGHWSAWQAARVEVAQQTEAKKLEEDPIEQRVVEQVIKQTNLLPNNEAPASCDSGPPAASIVDVVARLDAIAEQLAGLAPTRG